MDEHRKHKRRDCFHIHAHLSLEKVSLSSLRYGFMTKRLRFYDGSSARKSLSVPRIYFAGALGDTRSLGADGLGG